MTQCCRFAAPAGRSTRRRRVPAGTRGSAVNRTDKYIEKRPTGTGSEATRHLWLCFYTTWWPESRVQAPFGGSALDQGAPLVLIVGYGLNGLGSPPNHIRTMSSLAILRFSLYESAHVRSTSTCRAVNVVSSGVIFCEKASKLVGSECLVVLWPRHPPRSSGAEARAGSARMYFTSELQ